MRRVAALATWSFLVWVVLVWTLSLEQMVVGSAVALIVGVALAPLGGAAGPWRLLRPRRFGRAVCLVGYAAGRIVVANLRLARRIWAPSRPLSSGMVVIPTLARTDWEVTTVGLVTSVIVDNQLVDLDRSAARLQYHAVAVPSRDPELARPSINAGVERLLAGMGTDDD